jgi:hypothetical protein
MVLWTKHHRVMRLARAVLSALLLELSFAGIAAADCTPVSPPNVRSANGRGADGSMGSSHPRSSCAHELPVHTPEGVNRWSAVSAQSAASVATEYSRQTEYETPIERSLNELHWADSHDWIHNPPAWIKDAKNYRKQGMPIIHLMESKQMLIAFGISNHGKPGLYFNRKLPF